MYFLKRREERQKLADEEQIITENPAFQGDQSTSTDTTAENPAFQGDQSTATDTPISNPHGENPNFPKDESTDEKAPIVESPIEPASTNPPPTEAPKPPVKKRLRSLDTFRG